MNIFSISPKYGGNFNFANFEEEKSESIDEPPTDVEPFKEQPNSIERQNLNKILQKMPHVGLDNLGNTCYLNSGLQCLFSSKFIISSFYSSKLPEYLKVGASNKRMVDALQNLIMKFMEKSDDDGFIHTNPLLIKKIAGKYNPSFAEYSQQDSQEFMTTVIDAVHNETNGIRKLPKYVEIKNYGNASEVYQRYKENFEERNQSVLASNTYGIYCTEFICENCKKSSYNFEYSPFLTIPMPDVEDFRILCIDRTQKDKRISHIVNGFFKDIDDDKCKYNNYLPINSGIDEVSNKLCTSEGLYMDYETVYDKNAVFANPTKYHIPGTRLVDTKCFYSYEQKLFPTALRLYNYIAAKLDWNANSIILVRLSKDSSRGKLYYNPEIIKPTTPIDMATLKDPNSIWVAMKKKEEDGLFFDDIIEVTKENEWNKFIDFIPSVGFDAASEENIRNFNYRRGTSLNFFESLITLDSSNLITNIIHTMKIFGVGSESLIEKMQNKKFDTSDDALICKLKKAIAYLVKCNCYFSSDFEDFNDNEDESFGDEFSFHVTKKPVFISGIASANLITFKETSNYTNQAYIPLQMPFPIKMKYKSVLEVYLNGIKDSIQKFTDELLEWIVSVLRNEFYQEQLEKYKRENNNKLDENTEANENVDNFNDGITFKKPAPAKDKFYKLELSKAILRICKKVSYPIKKFNYKLSAGELYDLLPFDTEEAKRAFKFSIPNENGKYIEAKKLEDMISIDLGAKVNRVEMEDKIVYSINFEGNTSVCVYNCYSLSRLFTKHLEDGSYDIQLPISISKLFTSQATISSVFVDNDEEVEFKDACEQAKSANKEIPNSLFTSSANDEQIEIDNINGSSVGMTLEGCMQTYCKDAKVQNAYNCESCGKKNTTAFSKFYIWKLPKALLIHFKRFCANGTKNEDFIEYPIKEPLYLKKFFHPESEFKCDNYRFCAASYHSGYCGGGHYTALARGLNGLYYKCDDMVCVETEPTISRNAYVLIYESESAQVEYPPIVPQIFELTEEEKQKLEQKKEWARKTELLKEENERRAKEAMQIDSERNENKYINGSEILDENKTYDIKAKDDDDDNTNNIIINAPIIGPTYDIDNNEQNGEMNLFDYERRLNQINNKSGNDNYQGINENQGYEIPDKANIINEQIKYFNNENNKNDNDDDNNNMYRYD